MNIDCIFFYYKKLYHLNIWIIYCDKTIVFKLLGNSTEWKSVSSESTSAVKTLKD